MAFARSLLLLLCLAACDDSANSALVPCPARSAQRPADVSGTYRYSSPIYGLRGTISFAQDGERLRVLDTTYDNANDRRLAGEAELQGNFAAVTLSPINGDTDYEADVEFIFEDDRFCVLGFSDTNGDVGDDGSYRGRRATMDLPDAMAPDAR